MTVMVEAASKVTATHVGRDAYVYVRPVDVDRGGRAHREPETPTRVLRDDASEVWVIDCGFSEMAASDLLLSSDVAKLIAPPCLYVGAEPAVAPVAAVIDPGRLEQAGDRLYLWALSEATRTAQNERRGLLDGLRRRVMAVATATET